VIPAGRSPAGGAIGAWTAPKTAASATGFDRPTGALPRI
jgi:hypothetical protein